MKGAGKIAWTTADEIVKSFGCTLAEAIGNTAAIAQALESHKNNKLTMKEKLKKIDLG